jgi:hypothetical protein
MKCLFHCIVFVGGFEIQVLVCSYRPDMCIRTLWCLLVVSQTSRVTKDLTRGNISTI